MRNLQPERQRKRNRRKWRRQFYCDCANRRVPCRNPVNRCHFLSLLLSCDTPHVKSLAWMVNGRKAPVHGMLSHIYCYQNGEQPAVVCTAPKLTASVRINSCLGFYDVSKLLAGLIKRQSDKHAGAARAAFPFFSLWLNTGRLAAMLKLTVNEQPQFFSFPFLIPVISTCKWKDNVNRDMYICWRVMRKLLFYNETLSLSH